jgi:hypothetical protein
MRSSRLGKNMVNTSVAVRLELIFPEYEIAKSAENPASDQETDILASHMVFRERNSGRLVSRFLRSFTESM